MNKTRVAKKTTGKKAAKAPAEVLRNAKARIEEANKVPVPRLPGTEHPATEAARQAGKARGAIGAIPVPMTLNEICALMGPNCRAEDFASSAFETLAGQLYAVASLAESGGTYDGWQVVENIVARMKCAGQVVTWLESETSELPAVAQ